MIWVSVDILNMFLNCFLFKFKCPFLVLGEDGGKDGSRGWIFYEEGEWVIWLGFGFGFVFGGKVRGFKEGRNFGREMNGDLWDRMGKRLGTGDWGYMGMRWGCMGMGMSEMRFRDECCLYLGRSLEKVGQSIVVVNVWYCWKLSAGRWVHGSIWG